MYGHDRRFVRILKNALFFVYPRLLLSLENVSHVLRNKLPPVFGEGGDIALAQRASDDTFNRRGQDVFPDCFFSGIEEFLV